MKAKRTYSILTLLSIVGMACNSDQVNVADTQAERISTAAATLPPDTLELKETYNADDLPVNEYLTEQLKPIRDNFKRINSITNWTSIETVELSETTEGGEARFYYQDGELEKVVTQQFGETFQQLTESYLMNGELSFVFEKAYRYNRPLFYDSTAMKENNDTEVFDFDKSELIEDRSYFEKGKLLHQISSQDCGSPFADDYLLEEQKRLLAEFEKLIGLTSRK